MSDLEMKVLLDRAKIPTSNAETELKCLVKIWPSAELRNNSEPLQTSICLVFDCSASMLLQNKMNTAIESAKLIVDTISEIQKVSLVAFQSKVTVLVPESLCTGACKQKIKEQINEIRSLAGGSTNMTDGIKVGLDVLNRSTAQAKIMILLSDGAADFPETAERAAKAATEAKVQLFAVGIGEQYTADQLLRMATPSNGTVFGSSEAEKIKETFEDLANRIENFVATNVVLDLTFGKKTLAGLAYKASPEQAFIGNLALDKDRTVRLNVGNVECDKMYSFLFLATVPTGDGGLEVCSAKLTYDVPSTSQSGLKEDALGVIYSSNERETEELNGEVMEVFRRVSVTQLAERFVQATKAGNNEQAAKYLKILIKRYEEIGEVDMKNHYEELLKTLQEKGAVTNEMLNASVVASTVVAGGGELPQLVEDEF